MRRAANKDAGAGLWETLSGRVDVGEEPYDTALREIHEECGLGVKLEHRPFTAYSAKRNEADMIVIVYVGTSEAGEVVMSDEHDQYAWLTPQEFAARSLLTKLVATVTAAALAHESAMSHPGAC